MHSLQIRALNFIALPGIKTSNPGILKILMKPYHHWLFLEHAALAAYFMTEKSWTFCPYTTAIRLQKNGACIYELKNSPPEQVVYYLVNENRKTATIHKFLELLTEKLKTLPKDKITSFLS